MNYNKNIKNNTNDEYQNKFNIILTENKNVAHK